jgi:phosphoglycerate dehydrogenase-like enzyme
VLGMGTIGGKIAHRAARGFDMEVGYHNRRAVAGSPYRYFDNLVELANWAEFLVCAAPGGAGTRHLVDADVLTALGPKGYLPELLQFENVVVTPHCAARAGGPHRGYGVDTCQSERVFHGEAARSGSRAADHRSYSC